MDLYEHPANKFVAGFIGSPQMNFYEVKVAGNAMTFSDGSKMQLPKSVVAKLNGRQGTLVLGIRGEDIKLDPQNLDLYKENIMSATVESVEVMGNENNLYFNFGGTASVARVSKYEISKPGDTMQKIHFKAPNCWINDPNGFIWYKGQYHLFYQCFPYAPQWGRMHWGHAVSGDMIHWKDLPIALRPDQEYDCHLEGGCFSGSAVEKDGVLFLFYTATTQIDGVVRQTQCIATSKDGVNFEKYEGNPVIKEPPQGFSNDFRDPKVFEHNGRWYMVVGGCIGSAIADGDGRICLYESDDLFNWKYKGNVLESNGKLGTMMECPDMFELNGKWVVTCSPMNHPDYNKSLYCVGTMDFENCIYTIEKVGNMDVGFDYYAPQSFTDKDGNRILVAWQNGWLWMPWCTDWGPTSLENWRGCLSVPRKVHLDSENNLCMYPVKEVESLISQTVTYTDVEIGKKAIKLYDDPNRSNRIILKLDITKIKSRNLEICVLGKESSYTAIQIDFLSKIITLDKSHGDHYEGGRMNCPFELHNGCLELCILVDHSSVELYVNHGESCITTNVYPEENQTECWIQTPYKNAVVDYVQIDFLTSSWEV